MFMTRSTIHVLKTIRTVLFLLSVLLLFAQPTFAKEKLVNGRPWYESARIFYDWIRIGEDLDMDYAKLLIKKTKDTNCNTLAFCVQVGGYALWNSKVTPKYTRIHDMDLIGELARLCKENDIYFVPWWLGTSTGVGRVLKEHPGWLLLGPPQPDGSQRKWNYICYNSPYRDLIYEEVREILSNYEVDGIYFDQLPGSCYCGYCRSKFERTYNQPMPVVPEEEVVPLPQKKPAAQFPPLLREFRDTSIKGFCAGIRTIIDATQPGVCYIQNWIQGDRARLGVGIVDVVLPEFYQSNDLIPLGLKQRITRTYFNYGPIWGNVRHSVRHDARHFPVVGTQMLLMDCVANQSAPLMLDLCAMDFDATGTKELGETFSHIAKVFDHITGAQEVPYALLLHSLPTYENYLDEYIDGFEGFYRILFEAHIPVDIVSEEGIQQGRLQGAKVLIIPNAVFLSEQTVDAIHKAASNGMGIVATFMTGMRGPGGKLKKVPDLANLLGYKVEDIMANDTRAGLTVDPVLNVDDIDTHVFYYGSARTQHPVAHGLPENGLFSYQGGFVAVDPEPNAQVLADIHTPDHSRLYAEEYNRRGLFPGEARWPLAIVRSDGNTRTVYFTTQSDAQWRRAHAPEMTRLLENAIVWAGGQPPISTPDVPNSVEVRFFENKNRGEQTILLVNHSTNPLSRPGDAHIAVIRYITPHKDLEIRLNNTRAIESVVSLVGTPVKYTQQDGGTTISLAFLHLYDGIAVKYR
jgi:hypothetical protein